MQSVINKIQIFGERCSGTNYLKALLLKNFHDIEVNQEWGLKHYCCVKEGVEQANNYLFIAIHRNVFDWVRSFHAQPFHAGPELRNIPLSEFMRREWRGVYTTSTGRKADDPIMGKELMSERCPFTNKRYENILVMRNSKIQNWESLTHKVQNFYSLRYEDLKMNPELIVKEIGGNFSLLRQTEFTPVNSYKGRGGKQYTEKKYPPINQDEVELILSQIDKVQEELIGYDIEALCHYVQIERLEYHIQEQGKKINQLEDLLSSIISGKSFRIGRAMTWSFRKLVGRSKNKLLENYKNQSSKDS